MKRFARTERLVGPDGMEKLSAARVILFGVGGVGSWCAEALVRSGIGRLTIVDPDCVDESNINRQLPATSATVGRPKVEVLRERLQEINPSADISALRRRYEKGADFAMAEYDVIIDAIDSLTDKMNLLLEASATPAKVYCSLGAACKTDPTKVRVAEFFSVRGCPLGAALRKKMRQNKTLPSKPILCVYDDEVLPNLGAPQDPGPGKAVANGTFAHITGIFGFTLAGLVIQDILGRCPSPDNSQIPG
ncbi:MAG: tRNA threonylcarbamoyladenosine dehydratase [Bacteroidales bacterium]|nr:tRNA threonylcarbamoyladenosine dehydratase [Bacteroidales bacterium]